MYPKLNLNKCKYPERKECNFSEDRSIKRYEFMKYQIDPYNGCKGQWICICEASQ